MATVYITKELVSRVKGKIDLMRLAERRSDLPNIDKNHIVDASHIFNLGAWGAEHIHLLHAIPKEWLAKVTDANVHVTGEDENGTTIKGCVRFNGLTTAFMRPTSSYYNMTESTLTIDQLRALPEETPGHAELIARWEDTLVEQAINARWAKVTNDIVEFLDKCKSLNEAIKLFPGVRMYIDSDDIQRMEKKVERPTQRAKIVEQVDTEGLTAAAIAAKLAMAA